MLFRFRGLLFKTVSLWMLQARLCDRLGGGFNHLRFCFLLAGGRVDDKPLPRLERHPPAY